MSKYLLVTLILSNPCILFSHYPPDLISNIPPSDGFETAQNIADTYNNGRRQEEIQFNLSPNSIKDLVMPSQSIWDAMTREERALYLMNDERTSRAGIDYGFGPVKGLAFEGIGSGVDLAAQDWAQHLYDNQIFTHCDPQPTNCPLQRIDSYVGSSCTDFLPLGENLSFEGFSEPGYEFVGYIAKQNYYFNYVDSHVNWNHRLMNFYQNMNNNYGDADKEGVVGIGLVEGPSYGSASGLLLCVNLFDAFSSCSGNLTVDTDDLFSPCDLQQTQVSGSISFGVYSNGIIHSDAIIQTNGSVEFIGANYVSLDEGFQVVSGAEFEAYIQSCN